MSTSLREQLAETEAHAEALRQRIARAGCDEAGHELVFVGGANAGCHKDCCCSVPVYECKHCGASDYGDNAEATYVRANCDTDCAHEARSATAPADGDKGDASKDHDCPVCGMACEAQHEPNECGHCHADEPRPNR